MKRRVEGLFSNHRKSPIRARKTSNDLKEQIKVFHLIQDPDHEEDFSSLLERPQPVKAWVSLTYYSVNELRQKRDGRTGETGQRGRHDFVEQEQVKTLLLEKGIPF